MLGVRKNCAKGITSVGLDLGGGKIAPLGEDESGEMIRRQISMALLDSSVTSGRGLCRGLGTKTKTHNRPTRHGGGLGEDRFIL